MQKAKVAARKHFIRSYPPHTNGAVRGVVVARVILLKWRLVTVELHVFVKKILALVEKKERDM